jgi:hypothetical protein
MAKRIGLRPMNECPRCGEVQSGEHVWLCKQPDADQLWENSMEDLRLCLRTIQTPILTINAIIDGLQGWRRGENTQFNTHTDAGKAGAAQNEVGWKHFFEGHPHKIWQTQHQIYLSSTGKGLSSKRWVMSIIQKLWEIAWDMWEHRNGFLHDRCEGYDAQAANAKIRHLREDPLLRQIPSIKYLVKRESQDICSQTTAQKQQWIIRIKAALWRRQSKAEQEGMQWFLQRVQ